MTYYLVNTSFEFRQLPSISSIFKTQIFIIFIPITYLICLDIYDSTRTRSQQSIFN